MDVAKGMLLSQIYPMKLINVSVSSKHSHPPHPVQPEAIWPKYMPKKGQGFDRKIN